MNEYLDRAAKWIVAVWVIMIVIVAVDNGYYGFAVSTVFTVIYIAIVFRLLPDKQSDERKN